MLPDGLRRVDSDCEATAPDQGQAPAAHRASALIRPRPAQPSQASFLARPALPPRSRADVRALIDARTALERVLAIFEAAYGPDHPEVATTLGNLANIQQDLGQLADARATQRRALAIFEAAYGPDHPEVARTLGNLGIVQTEMSELAAARASQERALAIKEAAYGPDHPQVAMTLDNLSVVQLKIGELAGARATLARALAIKEAAYGPDHPQVAITPRQPGQHPARDGSSVATGVRQWYRTEDHSRGWCARKLHPGRATGAAATAPVTPTASSTCARINAQLCPRPTCPDQL